MLYRKKDTGESPKPLDGINLTTKIHGDKTLKGQFNIAKALKFQLIPISMNRCEGSVR